MKFVIFDLDETLGYFKQLYYLFSVVKKINASFVLTQSVFHRVLDVFPEFLRPQILDILLYLKQQKQFHPHTYLILYTNNTHPNWTTYIRTYMEDKIHEASGKSSDAKEEEAEAEEPSHSFFDKIIHAQNQHACRQHQRKHLDDLFRCIDYASQSPICYIDNEYHPGMKSRQTHYCKLSSYVCNLPLVVLSERLRQNHLLDELLPGVHPSVFENIYQHYSQNKYTRGLTDAERRYELRTSQVLMLKIRIFFMNTTTHKRRHTYSNVGSATTAGPLLLLPTAPSSSSSSSSSAASRSPSLHSLVPEITRVSEPLFSYYYDHATPSSTGGDSSTGRWVSRPASSSSKKTKKHRRVL